MKEEIPEREAVPEKDPYPDLKALREASGKTLKDVSRTTRIRTVYLEAIENGQFQFLPEQIYAEGFIRAYGRELGIDSSLILFHYRDYLRNFAGAEREQEKKKTLPPAPKRPADAARRADIGRPFFRWVKGHRQMLGRSLVVLFAAFAVFYFLYTDERPEPGVVQEAPATIAEKAVPADRVGPGEPAKEPGKEDAGTVAAPGQSGVPAGTEAKPVTQREPLNLVVTAKEKTWVRVTADEEPPFDILLRPGDRIERQAQDVFHIDLGNAGGVDIQFQGKQLDSVGKRGQVVHLVLPEPADR